MALHEQTATELLPRLRSGEVSSVELVEALFARADEVEPRVGAFAHQLRTTAREEAERADERRRTTDAGELGPLHGLPVTIKENIDTRGLPSTLGMRAWRHRIAEEDAVVVRLLREAGAIVLGKTNVPQTLLSPMETTNSLFGTTHNPWRHGHGPGGSSGGEGAAIAAGTSIAGVGTDIGGSIRTPASFCGVFGIKPTRLRWSNLGCRGVLAGQEHVQAQCGPLARCTADLVALLSAIPTERHAAVDPSVAPIAWRDPAAVEVPRLRIGYYEDDGYFTPAASVRRGVRVAAEMLEAAGCEVVRFTPPLVEEVLLNYFAGVSADGTSTLWEALEGEGFIAPLRTLGRIARMPTQGRRGLAKALGLMGEKRLEGMLLALGEKRVGQYWRSSARRTELRREVLRAWDLAGVDVVLAPAYMTTAAPIGMAHDFTLGFVDLARYNLLDFPAGVVPVTRARPDEIRRTALRDRLDKRAGAIEAESAGLPVGIQVVGRPWREDQVLAAMQALEDAARAREDFPVTPVTPSAT